MSPTAMPPSYGCKFLHSGRFYFVCIPDIFYIFDKVKAHTSKRYGLKNSKKYFFLSIFCCFSILRFYRIKFTIIRVYGLFIVQYCSVLFPETACIFNHSIQLAWIYRGVLAKRPSLTAIRLFKSDGCPFVHLTAARARLILLLERCEASPGAQAAKAAPPYRDFPAKQAFAPAAAV